MTYSPWTFAPNGQSASLAILNDWMPNGMPIILIAGFLTLDHVPEDAGWYIRPPFYGTGVR